MKTGIHPDYHQATVTCSCGHRFVIGATVKEIRVEICANCHPFYTGSQKLIDTAGRLERFQERLSKVTGQKAKSAKKSATVERQETIETNKDKLKELKKKLIQA